MRLLTHATTVMVWLAIACARPSGQQPVGGATRSSSSSNVLTQEQLAVTNAPNLYEAIRKLRPEWLSSRGATSVTDETPTVASVYMDGTNLGKVDALKEIRVLDVTQARYWDTGQASARFGMGHPRGVIELSRQ
jgi:hypothetical protein